MTFLDLLREHRIGFRESQEHHHVGRGWCGLDCPDCSPGAGAFRLGWNLERGYFSCWSCGYKPAWPTLRALGIPHHHVKDFLEGTKERAPEDERPRGKL